MCQVRATFKLNKPTQKLSRPRVDNNMMISYFRRKRKQVWRQQQFCFQNMQINITIQNLKHTSTTSASSNREHELHRDKTGILLPWNTVKLSIKNILKWKYHVFCLSTLLKWLWFFDYSVPSHLFSSLVLMGKALCSYFSLRQSKTKTYQNISYRSPVLNAILTFFMSTKTFIKLSILSLISLNSFASCLSMRSPKYFIRGRVRVLEPGSSSWRYGSPALLRTRQSW